MAAYASYGMKFSLNVGGEDGDFNGLHGGQKENVGVKTILDRIPNVEDFYGFLCVFVRVIQLF